MGHRVVLLLLLHFPLLQASAAWLPAIFKCSKPSTHATADSTTIIAAAIPHGHGPSKTTSTNQLAASTTNGAAASAGVKVAVASEPPSPVCADEVDRASCNDKAGCVWCEKGIMGMCFSQVSPLLPAVLLLLLLGLLCQFDAAGTAAGTQYTM
jgi:hypothetical protein